MTFLAEWYDPGLETDPAETVESVTTAEISRLARQASIVSIAMGMPRRLGGDASSEDLSLDKRRAKRISHVLMQCLDAWQGETDKPGPLPLDDGIRMEAASIDWSEWCKSQQVWLRNRIRYIVTWGRATGTEERLIKSMVTKLKNELGWLTYALRD